MADPKKLLLIIFQFAWGKCYMGNIPFASAPEADAQYTSASDCSRIFDDYYNMHAGATPFGHYPALGEEDHVAALMAPSGDQGNHDLYQTWNNAGSFSFEDSTSAPSHTYEAQTNLVPHGDHGIFSQGNNHLDQAWGDAGSSHYSSSSLYHTSYQDSESYHPQYDASYDPAAQMLALDVNYDPFKTQTLQSNKHESDSIGLLEVPLMPYYFSSISKLPYGSKKTTENKDLIESSFQAIKKAFDISPQMTLKIFEARIFAQNTSQYPAEILRLAFLGRLCIRNITFLLHTHMKWDDVIRKEVENTLHWLCNQLKDHPYSSISKAVSQNWEKPFDPSPMLTFKGKYNDLIISEHEAIDTKIIIFILETYYRTSNAAKWNHLFHEKYSFLNFFVRHASSCINKDHSKALKRHWKRFPHSYFLPWSNDIIVKNDDSFTENWKEVNGVMQRRGPINSEEWKIWSSWCKDQSLVHGIYDNQEMEHE